MTLPFTFATMPAGNVPAADLDSDFLAVGAMGITTCTATGTNTISLTPIANQPTISSYTTQVAVQWIQAATNTGACTINVSGVGAVALTKYGNVALTGGEIPTGWYAVALFDGTQFQLVGANPVGKQTIPLPAVAWTKRTTTGATSSQLESATNKINRQVLNFVDGSQTFAQCLVPLPKSYNGGGLTYRVYFESTVGSNNMVFGLQGLFLRNGDTIDSAFGTAVTTTNACGAATVLNIGNESATVTPGGTFAANCMLILQLYRDGGAGGDTNTGQGNLWGVEVYYTTNARDDT